MVKNVSGQKSKIENIKLGYVAAAKIVALYGDRYISLFERIHLELQKEETSSNLKLLATKICDASSRTLL